MGRALAKPRCCKKEMAADNPPDFDDPSYVPVDPEKLTTSDGSYDSPTAFLDRVPQRSPAKEPATLLDPEKVDRQTESPPEERSEHGDTAEDDPTSIADDSGAYSTIVDFVPPEGPGCSAEEGDEEEDGEGEGMTKGRFVQVRQSHSAKLEESKIYIKGSTVELQSLASFKKSRIRSRSKEQLEEEGIYQCLNITDEQRQQMGIMPEAIYTTLALQKSGDELENMSMEIGQNISRPGSLHVYAHSSFDYIIVFNT